MRIFLALLLCFACQAAAADFRPFVASSRASIERAHAGKPFVLAFWSVDCAYCAEELQQLRRLAESHPAIGLVLVSTDSEDAAAEAKARLDQWLPGLRTERWMFAGDDAEHLFFAVDKKWHGELPRAYFYQASGASVSVAGKLEPQWLERWVRTLRLP